MQSTQKYSHPTSAFILILHTCLTIFRHQPIDYFDKNVVIIRHPLDASISYFNGHLKPDSYSLRIDKRGRKVFGHTFPVEMYESEHFIEKFYKLYLGNWIEFHDKILRHCSENCLFVFYEEMKKDMVNQMTKILIFLGYKEPTYDVKGCLMLNSRGNFKKEQRSIEDVQKIHNLFSKEQMQEIDDVFERYKLKFQVARTLTQCLP